MSTFKIAINEQDNKLLSSADDATVNMSSVISIENAGDYELYKKYANDCRALASAIDKRRIENTAPLRDDVNRINKLFDDKANLLNHVHISGERFPFGEGRLRREEPPRPTQETRSRK